VSNINTIALILLVCWDRDGDEAPKRREDEPPE